MDPCSINIASLCSGLGGLELGLSLVDRRFRGIVYVEREAHVAALLVARMADQVVDEAPIWADVATFDGRPWRGLVDFVVAGIPCGPHSYAGNRARLEAQARTADDRWVWPHVARVIDEIEPSYVFLENVSGFEDAIPIVLEDLDVLGFTSSWIEVSASAVGADHTRSRWFGLAYSMRERRQGAPQLDLQSIRSRLAASFRKDDDRRSLFPPASGIRGDWKNWSTKIRPHLSRSDDGLPDRLERLGALGNGCVPLQAAYAFCTLLADLFNDRARLDTVERKRDPNVTTRSIDVSKLRADSLITGAGGAMCLSSPQPCDCGKQVMFVINRDGKARCLGCDDAYRAQIGRERK